MNNNGWISVKDKCPEIPKPYYDDEWEGMITPLTTSVIVWDGETVFVKSFGIIAWEPEITHWMPLPSPPKTSDKD